MSTIRKYDQKMKNIQNDTINLKTTAFSALTLSDKQQAQHMATKSNIYAYALSSIVENSVTQE